MARLKRRHFGVFAMLVAASLTAFAGLAQAAETRVDAPAEIRADKRIEMRVENHDHDRARAAVAAGEVLPLRTILERVEREYPGQTMEVELDRKDGRWIYEIKQLRTGGELVKLKIDARDGTVLGVAQRRKGDR